MLACWNALFQTSPILHYRNMSKRNIRNVHVRNHHLLSDMHFIIAWNYSEIGGYKNVPHTYQILHIAWDYAYLIGISKNFTMLDMGTALMLRSKYSQKMYEMCCQFGGDFRYMVQRKWRGTFIRSVYCLLEWSCSGKCHCQLCPEGESKGVRLVAGTNA